MRTESQIKKAVEATLGAPCTVIKQEEGWKVLTPSRITEEQGDDIVKRLGSPGGYWGSFYTLNPPEHGLYLKDE